jgi:D-alanyl-lipoteichoic acid acyltransferase DltB (MBOAT superfamily)
VLADVAIGFYRFIWGLFKKVVVADVAASFVDAVYNNYPLQPGCLLALATVLFAIQIYCDFSGYSDMAIGIARMLGFRFNENFRLPYFAKDVSSFWRRWHISLSTWLRDYLYISFGGSRNGKFNTYRNLMLTMIIGGFWHGASWNFIIWGFLNGCFLAVEKMIGLDAHQPKNLWQKLARVAYTFTAICITWVFFRSVTVEQSLSIFSRIFFEFRLQDFQLLDVNVFTTIVFGICILLLVEWTLLRNKSFDQLYFQNKTNKWLLPAAVCFTIFIVLFGNSNGGQFIYFQF